MLYVVPEDRKARIFNVYEMKPTGYPIPNYQSSGNIIQTEQFKFKTIYVYAYVHLTTINESRETTDLNEIEKRFIGQFGGRKGDGEMM